MKVSRYNASGTTQMNGTGATTWVSWAVVATRSAAGTAAKDTHLAFSDQEMIVPTGWVTMRESCCARWRAKKKVTHAYNVANTINNAVQNPFWKLRANIGSITNG